MKQIPNTISNMFDGHRGKNVNIALNFNQAFHAGSRVQIPLGSARKIVKSAVYSMSQLAVFYFREIHYLMAS